MSRPRTAVIIVAAGKGERAQGGTGLPKQYASLAGQPLLTRTIKAFLALGNIDLVQPVIGADHAALFAQLNLSHAKLLPPVTGGITRQSSCLAGLHALERHNPVKVLIHDAARPIVSPELVGRVLAGIGKDHAGALPVLPVTDTIKHSPDGRRVGRTEDRTALFAAQTPQGFDFAAILSAHRQADNTGTTFTDDAAIAEKAGLKIALVTGDEDNFKITVPGDFARAEQIMGWRKTMEFRVGNGYDVHPFTQGDAVIIGGVHIPHTMKLKGHSDADVGLHALTDAIYGALGEGDIGTHFPPSDPQWKGVSSSLFLEHAAGRVTGRNGRIVNLDLTIIAEAPSIGPHISGIRARIAGICGVSTRRIGVKATTSEKLGFIGRREGIAALASASIEIPREE